MNKKDDPVKIALNFPLKSPKLSNCSILFYSKQGARTRRSTVHLTVHFGHCNASHDGANLKYRVYLNVTQSKK